MVHMVENGAEEATKEMTGAGESGKDEKEEGGDWRLEMRGRGRGRGRKEEEGERRKR